MSLLRALFDRPMINIDSWYHAPAAPTILRPDLCSIAAQHGVPGDNASILSSNVAAERQEKKMHFLADKSRLTGSWICASATHVGCNSVAQGAVTADMAQSETGAQKTSRGNGGAMRGKDG